MNGPESVTSLSLLERLRLQPADQPAWKEFTLRYGRKVRAWCRRWGLQEADADDVTQNVLADLARQMSRFEYQPGGRFRAWLKTVAYRAWCDYLERRRPDTGAGDSAVLHLLESVAAREDFLTHLEAECDRELLDEAVRRVRARVQFHTWEAFRLLTQEGLSGAEAGERLGMKPGTVFVAKCKVQKMLQETIRELEQDA